MKTWKDTVLDFFFPPKCVFCQRLLKKGETDCCISCRLNLPENDAIRLIPGAEACRAPLRYEGPAREAMIRYKFGGRTNYAGAFARILASNVGAADADLITWIPVSFRRRLERGYDQTELLAKELSKTVGIPCARLLKKKHTGRQSAAGGPEERKRNVKGAFSMLHPDNLHGMKLLLIDDVCTTGATLSEAVSILRQAGAGGISCAVVMLTQE